MDNKRADKLKYDSDTIEKYKALMATKRLPRKYRTDYDATFAPRE